MRGGEGIVWAVEKERKKEREPRRGQVSWASQLQGAQVSMSQQVLGDERDERGER